MSFQLTSNIPQITSLLKQRASRLVRTTANNIEASVKVSMGEPKSGRTYKKGKAPGIGKRGKRLKDRRKTHTRSAPGESPAIDTTALVTSVGVDVTGKMSAVVGTNMEYAEALEFGSHKMAPRPFLGPAFEEAEPGFDAGLKELLK